MQNKILSEFAGTALLLAIITGSGIMGETLAAGNTAVALLGNSIATGCGLYVLITLLGPVSGAHFNPLVSLMCWQDGAIDKQTFVAYAATQITGAITGVWLTNALFALPILQISAKPRHGFGIWLSEFLSTILLLSVIKLGAKVAPEKLAMLVALTVTAGYWFSSSTFFANSAVTLARSLSNSFVGIAPIDMVGFILAQLAAVMLVITLSKHKSV